MRDAARLASGWLAGGSKGGLAGGAAGPAPARPLTRRLLYCLERYVTFYKEDAQNDGQ